MNGPAPADAATLARRFMRWSLALCALAAALVALVTASTEPGALSAMSALAALLALAFGAVVVFDALLFRLIASHGDHAAGCAAVDDLLARMALKAPPAWTRPLDKRAAGTRRLLLAQAALLSLAAALATLALSGSIR